MVTIRFMVSEFVWYFRFASYGMEASCYGSLSFYFHGFFVQHCFIFSVPTAFSGLFFLLLSVTIIIYGALIYPQPLLIALIYGVLVFYSLMCDSASVVYISSV